MEVVEPALESDEDEDEDVADSEGFDDFAESELPDDDPELLADSRLSVR